MATKKQTEEEKQALIKKHKEKLLKEVSDWLDFAVLDDYNVETVSLCCKKDHTTIKVEKRNEILVVPANSVVIHQGYCDYFNRRTSCPYCH
jgi:hypothetical protein